MSAPNIECDVLFAAWYGTTIAFLVALLAARQMLWCLILAVIVHAANTFRACCCYVAVKMAHINTRHEVLLSSVSK